MRRRRVLVMMHEDLIPPDDISGLTDQAVMPFATEYDVVTAMRWLGHEVVKLGLHDELAPLRAALREVKPHVVFNLLEEFHGEAVFDQHVVSYLELQRAAYTGCNPRGLVLGRDKALSKKILHYHRIRCPKFAVFPMGRRPRRPAKLTYPLIVKSLIEEGSTGISEASVVHNDEKLIERVHFIHRSIGTDAIAEQFIDGREVYGAVMGNHRLTVFPPWELKIDDLRSDAPRIATRRVKFDLEFQEKYNVKIGPANFDADLLKRYENAAKRIYKVLGLSGYARIDFRLTPRGELYFLEANPNPDIAAGEEFSSAAKAGGFEYERLLQRILTLGMSHSRGLIST
ncbi:MAG: D-alanine--D-alanine ligase [Myxococcota bacterium]